MEITGERYLPERDADWTLEHTHRYLLACEFASGKEVLDIACGDGYGSRMLADVAKHVTGVDISRETIDRAKEKYPHQRLIFIQGNVTEIPISDNSMDLVVSFETLEHLIEHDDMIREIQRVLRPGGMLIISSPDKHEYSDLTGYTNAYHVKELYRHEFEALLRKNFSHIRMVGQRIVFGSVMGSEDPAAFISWQKDEPESRGIGLKNAEYLIALAGNSPLPSLPSGILKTPINNSDYARDIAEKLNKAKEDIHWYKNWEKEARIHIATLETQTSCLENRVRELEMELSGMYASRSWRITAPLRSIASMVRGEEQDSKQKAPAPKREIPLPGAIWPPDVRALERPLDLTGTASPSNTQVGVFLHVYYPELAPDMAVCLRHLPETARIHVSTDTDKKRDEIAAVFTDCGFGARTDIRVLPNRGWDIGPFFSGFNDVIFNYDLILRLHSKRSTFIYGNVGDTWRNMLFTSLAGSELRVNTIMGAFANDETLGMVCPPNLEHYADSLTIGENYHTMRDLLEPHGIAIEPDSPVDFPMGSMFWCRPAVLGPWFEKKWTSDDFSPTDVTYRDATLAHALERLFFFGCGITGYTWGRLPE